MSCSTRATGVKIKYPGKFDAAAYPLQFFDCRKEGEDVADCRVSVQQAAARENARNRHEEKIQALPVWKE